VQTRGPSISGVREFGSYSAAAWLTLQATLNHLIRTSDFVSAPIVSPGKTSDALRIGQISGLGQAPKSSGGKMGTQHLRSSDASCGDGWREAPLAVTHHDPEHDAESLQRIENLCRARFPTRCLPAKKWKSRSRTQREAGLSREGGRAGSCVNGRHYQSAR